MAANGGARSWIDGTMEVISGLAPRPSTPQRGQHSQHVRSAPNSPMGGGSRSSYPGIQRAPSHDYPGITRAPSYDYPAINRVPSADAMERSLHNDSGHGKSTAQIIRDLKASNAHFSAKTAEMEAEFMNEINRVTRTFEEKNRTLEASLKEKSQQLSSMEARCSSTEARIREQNAHLVKLKDENAFQRMTISDLKNQLREFQDAENDKRDEVDKWGMEKEEMAREIENLREQVDTLKQGVEANTGQDGQQMLQSWKRLEESQQALTVSNKRLHETQSALATIENTNKRTVKEHARVVQEHSQEIARLKKKHTEAQAEWSKSEMEMQAKIERLESDENPVIKELNAQLQECDATIGSLRGELERYSTQVKELNKEITNVTSEAKSREAYRREEAEDLRVMLDAQADAIDQLKEELDECQREIFTKEDDLVEAEKELEEQIDRCKELKKEVESLKTGGGSGGNNGDGRVFELENQLTDARKSLVQLEKELEETNVKHDALVHDLRQEINELIADRDDVENRLVAVEEERDQARQEIEGFARDRSLDTGGQSTEASEIVVLKEKLTAMELELNKSYENTRRLGEAQAELDVVKEILKEKCEEAASLQLKVEEGTRSVSEDEIEALRNAAKRLDTQKKELEMTKKQLLDAQIALVALDNERKKLAALCREKSEELDRLVHEAETSTVEKNEFATRIAAYVEEVNALKTKLNEKEKALELASSRSIAMNGNIEEAAADDGLRKEIATLKEWKSKLSKALETLKDEKNKQEIQMKEKLVDRDTTISALVKSSVTQDQKLRTLRAELESLKGVDVLSLGSASAASRDVGIGEDIECLRSSLNEYKETEKKLRSELSSYEKTLFAVELEAQRLRDEMEGNYSGEQVSELKKEMDAIAADHQEKIQERDAAIATLVKQSMSQEVYVASLEAKIASLKAELESMGSNKSSTSPSWEEVRRLRKESEIFAGQIIEQDEEMESLKGELEGYQSEIVSLKTKVEALKAENSSAPKRRQAEVAKLRAALDELQEANRTQLLELRDLRRELREAKVEAGQIRDLKIELDQAKQALEASREREGGAKHGDSTVTRELANSVETKESLEASLSEQNEFIRRLKADSGALEAQLNEREDANAALKNELSKLVLSKNNELAALQSEVDRLKDQLAIQAGRANEAQTSFEKFRQSVENTEAGDDIEKESLRAEISELQRQLNTLNNDREHIQELKDRLARAEEDRESVEKNIVDSYERKMSLLKLNKDLTIDGLRKDLAEAKGRNVGDLDGAMNQNRQLEMEKQDLRDELDATLDQKNAKIYALEQHCRAQEQLVENMRAEMDQLQSTMERTTLNRRAEIDEMQQEVLDSTAKTTRQEREITALKIELEETKAVQEAKIEKLLDQISSMEKSPLARAVAEQHVDHRLDDLKQRLEQMKWHNTSLEQENSKLRSRLERAELTNKAVEDEMDRIVRMEEEIAFLRSRVKEYEERQESNISSASVEKPPMPDIRGRSVQSAFTASPARRTSSKSGRLSFLKIRTRGSSKDFSSDDLPPLPGDD